MAQKSGRKAVRKKNFEKILPNDMWLKRINASWGFILIHAHGGDQDAPPPPPHEGCNPNIQGGNRPEHIGGPE